MIKTPKTAPKIASPEHHLVVGQGSEGRWLVLAAHDLGAALFNTRQDALHVAGFETGHRPGAITIASDPLHLDF